MNVGLIQKAERQMMLDGKSASEIDAMKSAYRKQVFNPDGYSQTAGLGSFASGGEAYGPPPVSGPAPQGIASFENGGEAAEEVYDAGGRFQFDKNTTEPSSVSFLRKMFAPTTYDTSLEKARKIKAGEMPVGYEPPGVRLSREFVGMTPLGTMEAGRDMYDEYNQEDSDYLKLGIMGAAELAGYIPLAGPPIKKMIRGGRGNVPINKNVFDGSEEIIEVYHATPNAPFEKLDANTSDLNKDGAFGPGDYFSLDSMYPSKFVGGKGSLLSAKVDVSRMLDARSGGKPFTPDQTEGLIEALSRRTDLNGKNLTVVQKDNVLSVSYVRRPLFADEPLADRSVIQKIPLNNPQEAFKKIKEITNNIKNPLQKDARGYSLARNDSTNTENLSDVLNESGFTGVVGVQEASGGGKSNLVVFDNSVYTDGGRLSTVIDQGVIPEDIGFSASRYADEYIDGNEAKIVEDYRRSLEKENVNFAGTPDFRTPEDIERIVKNYAKNYADGGAVMNGIGTLNETARNMTRGPRGIGAYQQFADGGEGVRPQSRPPQIRPQSRPAQIRPQSRPPEIEEMAEIQNYLDNFSDEKYFEINAYDINGETQNAIDFKDGMRMFMPDVERMITSSGMASQPVVGKETGQEVLEFLQENNPTSEEFINYFSSARLADGGQVTAPMQKNLLGDPHKLVYINPEEERLLQGIGGYGGPVPGSNGVDAYGFWSDLGNNVKNFFSGNTSDNSAPSNPGDRSTAGSASYDRFQNLAQQQDNNSPAPQPYSPAPAEDTGIMSNIYNKALDFTNPNQEAIAAKRLSGITGNPNDPRNQGLTMFPGPVSLGLKGLAYLGGLRKTDPIINVKDDKNVYQSGAGEYYTINSVTGLPYMVEGADDLTFSSKAQEKMDTMSKYMMDASDESGPNSCGPGYIWNGTMCVPATGAMGLSGSAPAGLSTLDEGGVIKYASDFLPQTQMFADGGQVMGQRLYGGTGPGSAIGSPYTISPEDSMPQNPFHLNLSSQRGVRSPQLQGAAPLQQYGQYLEQQYGEPDFAQKRDQFLQEVSQKEQQTFQDDTPMPMLDQDNRNLGDLMGGGPQPFYNSQLGETMFTNRAFDFAPLNPSMGPLEQGVFLDQRHYQLFADGGPVSMSNGGVSSTRPQARTFDGNKERSEARANLLETIYGLESNTDYDKWNLRARNTPTTPLSSMTVKEIMNFQKDDDGPAAGAGQIKYDTFTYLIKNGVISANDVFSSDVQDKAVNRLIDRRGFVSWFEGNTSTEEFGSDMAKEFASLPLLEARVVKGEERQRGQSRYANNEALMGADAWQNVLNSSINMPQTMIAETGVPVPQTTVPQTFAGSPSINEEGIETAASQPTISAGNSGIGSFKSSLVPPAEVYAMRGPLQKGPPVVEEEVKEYGSLYEKYAPQSVQNALQGIGYYNSPMGPSGSSSESMLASR